MSASKKIFFLTIALLLCFVIAESDYEHDQEHEHGPGCGHGVEEFNPGFLDVDEDTEMGTDERLLASGSYPKIRFYTHFDTLKSGSSAFRSYIRYDLVPAVIDYLESAIRVKYPAKKALKVASNVKYVCGDPTPRVLLTNGVNADYFYYFTAGYDSGSYVATSTFCYLADKTNRPIVAKVRFNINLVEVPNGNALTHEKNIYLVMHEMVHSLGFTQNLFKYFLDDRGNTRRNHIRSVSLDGKRRQVLDVPAITNRVRKHFGCSSLPGAYLENNGGGLTAGSHFERRHFLMDIMTSGVLNGRRLSEFTLAVLESTGWYVPDYSFAEPNHFGAGQGCGFVNNKCSSSNTQFDEFCGRSGERGCFASGLSGGKCNSDKNSDGCRYYVPHDSYDCSNVNAAKFARLPELQEFGKTANSKCFNGDLSKKSGDSKHSFCFTYNCVGSGSGTRLEVQVGNHKVVCSGPGGKSVPGYKGSIECPDPLSFCKTIGRKYCPRNCMGRGRCSNGKCACNKGFKGPDCSLRV